MAVLQKLPLAAWQKPTPSRKRRGSLSFRLGPAFLLRSRADGSRRLPFGLLTLDHNLTHLAGLEQPSLDQLFHQGLVLLFMFVRQGVLVGTQAHDDVFF